MLAFASELVNLEAGKWVPERVHWVIQGEALEARRVDGQRAGLARSHSRGRIPDWRQCVKAMWCGLPRLQIYLVSSVQ